MKCSGDVQRSMITPYERAQMRVPMELISGWTSTFQTTDLCGTNVINLPPYVLKFGSKRSVANKQGG